MWKRYAGLVVLLALLFSPCPAPAAPRPPQIPPAVTPAPKKEASVPGSMIAAEGEGTGTTRGEALADARRDAARQAVGAVSKGVTQVIDDRVRENVVQLSRAYIEKYEVTQERNEGRLWRVKVKAWIRRENLLSGLLEKNPDKSPFDGAGLYTRALTRRQQITEAAEMLVEVFSSFPYENYVHTAVGAEGLNAGAGALTLNVRFSFDRERYFAQAVPLFASILDYVAEAKVKDVPFVLDLTPSDPVVVEPPSELDALSKYMDLMELGKENRYMDLPGAGEFANVYLLKKNYYFDCYRVPAEAFAVLMENLLRPETRNRLSGKMFSEAELKIAFKTKAGQLVKEHLEPLNLYNVMIFANLAALNRSPYVKGGEPGQLDERRHALFILPCLGTTSGKDANDYLLIESETASISVNLPSKDVQLTSQTDCTIGLRRD